MVATADAATYELLKWASVKHFNEYDSSKGKAVITDTTDSTGNLVVHITIKVTSTSGESYTLNIYNTTARFMVNEKNATYTRGKPFGCII